MHNIAQDRDPNRAVQPKWRPWQKRLVRRYEKGHSMKFVRVTKKKAIFGRPQLQNQDELVLTFLGNYVAL